MKLVESLIGREVTVEHEELFDENGFKNIEMFRNILIFKNN